MNLEVVSSSLTGFFGIHSSVGRALEPWQIVPFYNFCYGADWSYFGKYFD